VVENIVSITKISNYTLLEREKEREREKEKEREDLKGFKKI